MFRKLVICLILFSSVVVCAQEKAVRSPGLKFTGLKSALDTLSSRCQIYFSYSDDLIKDFSTQRFQVRPDCDQPDEMLRSLFHKTGIEFRRHGSYVVLFSDARLLFSIYVIDQNTLSALPGSVLMAGQQRLGISDPYGMLQFNIGLLKNADTFVLLSPGYIPRSFTRQELRQWRNKSLPLTDLSLLPEFEKYGTNKLTWKLYRGEMFSDILVGGANILSTMGEQDALQSVRMMPGVTGGAESIPGLSVRGNGPDQNLILLDEVPLYHAYHLFGFSSVLGQAAVSKTELYKNHAPSRYSGRSGSVIRMNMQSGNFQKHKAYVSVGILQSGLGLSGPIQKNKASYSLHLRRSNTDFLILPVLRQFPQGRGVPENFNYSFYDMHLKIQWKIGMHQNISANVFRASDRGNLRNTLEKESFPSFLERNRRSFNWGSDILSMKWEYAPLERRIRVEATAYYSSYQTVYRESDELNRQQKDSSILFQYQELRFGSGISDVGLRAQMKFQFNKNLRLESGFHSILHRYQPAETEILNRVNGNILQDTSIGLSASFPFEQHIFSEIRWDSKDQHWKGIAGINVVGFSGNGPLRYQIQPRISLGWQSDSLLSMYAGYQRNGQFLHWLPGNLNGLPVFQWIPVNEEIQPLLSDQVFMGASYTKTGWMIRSEAFVRNARGALEMVPGKGGFLEEANTDILRSGIALAYGTETMIRAESEKLSFFAAHTWTRSYRRIEDINLGNWYPYLYDIPHDIKIQTTYKYRKIVFTALWLYHSGKLLTLPTGRYETEILGQRILKEDYTRVNNYRLPAYHRLDLNVSLHRKKKYFLELWRFGIFNAYNHINPILARIESSEQNQLSIQPFGILPLMPFVHYEIHF